ncbi:MAG: AEC family transporter [Alphaproteobacteria bacterium]|nr:AEC family transporter [Alphaproteobacteria bacterium]
MLHAFLNSVLPVFAVVGVGFALGRRGLFDTTAAAAVNRFVFYIALPVLLFRLLSDVPFDRFEWALILAYLLSEIALYAAGYLVARIGFRRPQLESLLLGMAAAFANHVFFVLPIARQIFGETAALPIVAIVSLDAIVLYAGTVLILDVTSDAARGASVLRVLRLCGRNPQIIAIVAGVAANLLGARLVGGFEFFARFVGETAAPCALFALGVILISQKDEGQALLPIAISALKLIVMPVVAWLLIVAAFGVRAEWAGPALLVAAGPAGAMPFVLALQYKVPVAAIARTILISTVGSLLTVTVMSQYG